MTWQPVYAVDGGTISGPVLRLQQQSATRGGEGIVEAGDLRVQALAVPGSAVRVAAGACTIVGREVAWQGSYYGHNVGDDVVDIAATDSAGGRSDLVVARIEDPTINGSPWNHDPSQDPLIYTRVIPGVPPGTTAVPAGAGSAIPLARIDIPASTATITQSMITDLRQMMDPRRQRVLRVQRGVDPIDLGGNVQNPDWENWPNLVWPDVVIPEWATQVQMVGHWGNVLFGSADLASGSGSTDAAGRARIALGYGAAGGATDIQTQNSIYNFNLSSNATRVGFMAADQRAVPAAMRGQRANLRMQVSGTAGVRGRLRADAWSNFYVDLEFLELPTLDVDA
ncbi:hypothetical protein GCM10027294_43850 [Marinactinospora endophytica]